MIAVSHKDPREDFGCVPYDVCISSEPWRALLLHCVMTDVLTNWQLEQRKPILKFASRNDFLCSLTWENNSQRKRGYQ